MIADYLFPYLTNPALRSGSPAYLTLSRIPIANRPANAMPISQQEIICTLENVVKGGAGNSETNV